jgi:hypothetical protein
MIIRKVDTENDWLFGKGSSDYARDEAAIAENIKTRLLSWLNDCFYAMTDGIDYQQLMDKGQQANLLLAIKSTILASEGVVAINSVTAELDVKRNLDIEYNIDTIYSQNFINSIENIVTQGV